MRLRAGSLTPVYADAGTWLGRSAGGGVVARWVLALSKNGIAMPYISTMESGASAGWAHAVPAHTKDNARNSRAVVFTAGILPSRARRPLLWLVPLCGKN